MSDALFPHAGYSVARAITITATTSVFALTDHTDEPTASKFPQWCEIVDIEIERLSVASGSPTEVTAYVCRDEDGDKPITPGTSAGASRDIDAGLGDASLGGAVIDVGKDFHWTPVTGAVRGTIYLALAVDNGSITANVRINWRGRALA